MEQLLNDPIFWGVSVAVLAGFFLLQIAQWMALLGILHTLRAMLWRMKNEPY